MTVAFDNTFLTLLLNPASPVRPHPKTGIATVHMKSRIDTLIDTLTTRRETLIIPTPAMAEVMCMVRPAALVLSKLGSYRCIEPYPFDQKCAVTLSDLAHKHRPEIKKLKSAHDRAWQHVKVDMQIVAVAVTYGADALYTDDDGQASFAELCGLNIVRSWELPLDDKYNQADLFEGMTGDNGKKPNQGPA